MPFIAATVLVPITPSAATPNACCIVLGTAPTPAARPYPDTNSLHPAAITNENRAENNQRKRLAELLELMTPSDSVHQTAIKSVELWRWAASNARHAVVYEPKTVILAQGYRRGYLADRTFRYDADNYLVLCVPLPFECETMASGDEPLLSFTVALDPIVLGGLLLEIDEVSPIDANVSPLGIYSASFTADLRNAAIRLIDSLRSPLTSRVLGRQTARELIFWVLLGEYGKSRRTLASRSENSTRIARVLRYVHSDYAQPLTTEGLAKRAGILVSSRYVAAQHSADCRRLGLYDALCCVAPEAAMGRDSSFLMSSAGNSPPSISNPVSWSPVTFIRPKTLTYGSPYPHGARGDFHDGREVRLVRLEVAQGLHKEGG